MIRFFHVDISGLVLSSAIFDGTHQISIVKRLKFMTIFIYRLPCAYPVADDRTNPDISKEKSDWAYEHYFQIFLG